jgi:hypothetical protein
MMTLREIFDSQSTEERTAFAHRIGMSPAYLWQLATQWKSRQPSLEMVKKIVAADDRLTVEGLVNEFAKPPAKPAKRTKARA